MRHIILFACVCSLAACDGASAESGLDALLIVEGAQFVPSAMPEASGGPEITSVLNLTNTFRPGEVDRPLSGTLSLEATSVLLSLEGDRGHWILVAGAPEVTVPDQPTFNTRLTLSETLSHKPLTISLSAVDAQGRIGEPQSFSLEPANAIPRGELVVTLTWDRDADLDLRVVDPTGVEIWSRNPNSATSSRPGTLPSQAELDAGGALDIDSNANCAIDGKRQENIVWTQPPPTGRYRVLVDTFSMCAERSARWRVEVRRDGELSASAEGITTPHDTRHDHDSGAGLLVLEFHE